MIRKSIVGCIAALSLVTCHAPAASSDDTESERQEEMERPVFSADSCMARLLEQTAFGARVPNSAAHEACGAYLADRFQRYGAEVSEQRFSVTAWDGNTLRCVNIQASYRPELKNRVLLCAHWDSRPWCDEDENPAMAKTPVLAANDGASGVAVLLEVARCLSLVQPAAGVDIVLFDAEDYGRSEYEDSFCLGSRYWASRVRESGYMAAYGILLDMVGDRSAVFRKDAVSLHFAPDVADRVWKTAAGMGYGNLFDEGDGGSIIDDHYYVNQLAGIPCIDIIHYDNGFPDTWHTARDTPDAISPEVLGVVGSVVLSLLY